MITPLVSVVVPIYNVKKYLRKCLDSLKNQTMSEIEVIMIDDGSTDGSGDIADEYAVADERFRIFHTENRGLSAARNRGIDESRSDCLMFVDSDDWVDRDFCRVPYEAAKKYGADLVIFNRHFASQSGRIKRSKADKGNTRFINHETAIDVGGGSAWNKIYKKSIFNNIRYPEGHIFEEIGTTHKLIYRAERIIMVPDYLYYYRYRQESITHSLTDIDDLMIMSKKRYEELLNLGYPREKAHSQLLESALRYCGKAHYDDNNLYLESVSIIERESSVYVNNMDRMKKFFFCFNKKLYRFLYGLAVGTKNMIWNNRVFSFLN